MEGRGGKAFLKQTFMVAYKAHQSSTSSVQGSRCNLEIRGQCAQRSLLNSVRKDGVHSKRQHCPPSGRVQPATLRSEHPRQEEPAPVGSWATSDLQIVSMMLPYLYLVPYRDVKAVTADLASSSWKTDPAVPVRAGLAQVLSG